ncbi:hypothetical protein D3C73_278700 [compost metagenome]
MLKMNWEAFYDLLDFYRSDDLELTYSDLLEFKDKLQDLQDDIVRLIDAYETDTYED